MKNLSIVALLATVATMAAADPISFAASSARALREDPVTCDRKDGSTIAVYDFNEFRAGDTIKDLGAGDVTVRAFKNIKKTIETRENKQRIIKEKVQAVAMAFDSANPSGGDWDLETDDQGIVLIVSEDGDSSDPDDNARGGQFNFKFQRSGAIVNAVSVLDAEEGGSIILKRTNGRQEKVKIPKGSDGDFAVINIGVTGVQKMIVKVNGSAAIPSINVTYCDDVEHTQDPAPAGSPSRGPSVAPIGSFLSDELICPDGAKPTCNDDGRCKCNAAPSSAPNSGPSAGGPSAAPTTACVCEASATYEASTGAVTIDFDMCGNEPLASDFIGIYPCDAPTVTSDQTWWDSTVCSQFPAACGGTFDFGFEAGQVYVDRSYVWFAYTCGDPAEIGCQRNRTNIENWPSRGVVTIDPNVNGAKWAFPGGRTLDPGCYKVLLNREVQHIISPPPYPTVCKPWAEALEFQVPEQTDDSS